MVAVRVNLSHGFTLGLLYTIVMFCILSIFAVNKDLLFLLWEKVKHWSSEQCIAKLFTDMVSVYELSFGGCVHYC